LRPVYTSPGTAVSPLFPYTTLFRSKVVVVEPSTPEVDTPGADAAVVEEAVDLAPTPTPPPAEIRASATPAPLRDSSTGRRSEVRDRKSTRLNSSHVKTSYAVFCLKK